MNRAKVKVLDLNVGEEFIYDGASYTKVENYGYNDFGYCSVLSEHGNEGIYFDNDCEVIRKESDESHQLYRKSNLKELRANWERRRDKLLEDRRNGESHYSKEAEDEILKLMNEYIENLSRMEELVPAMPVQAIDELERHVQAMDELER